MKAFGLDQGRKGQNNLSEDIRKICVRPNSIIDLEGYDKGFNSGWSEYCTPINGLENGKKGEIYKSYCPPEKEDLYHEKFLIGKKIYEKKDQASEIETKIKELIPGAQHDLASKEELNRLKESLLELNREIQSLEQSGMKPARSY
jgi:polyhydroxyalkanoate synthesis regulator phasin